MERKHSSSSSSSSQYSAKWCLYGQPQLVDVNVEKENKEDEPQHLVCAQPRLSRKQVREQITQLITPLRSAVLSRVGSGTTYASTQSAIATELRALLECIEAGTLPNAPCYLLSLPVDVFNIMLSFITPRELFCVRGVSRVFSSTSQSLFVPSIRYFCVGRVAYFAYESEWLLGVVMCVVDTINPDTFEEHHGVHAYTVGGGVTYISNLELVQYSYVGDDVPSIVPSPIPREYSHTPYGNDPHQLCGHGHYPGDCSTNYATTAPSTCLVLDEGFDPHLRVELVGCVVDVEKFTRHPLHIQSALEREDRYGVSFKGRGSRRMATRVYGDIRARDALTIAMLLGTPPFDYVGAGGPYGVPYGGAYAPPAPYDPYGGGSGGGGGGGAGGSGDPYDSDDDDLPPLDFYGP